MLVSCISNEVINDGTSVFWEIGGSGSWQKGARNELLSAAGTAWGTSILRNNPVFQEALTSLDSTTLDRQERVGLIPRIEAFHSFSHLINRTRRRDIGTFCIRKPEAVSVTFTGAQEQLHNALLDFQAKALAAVHGVQNVKFMMSTVRRRAASCILGLAPFITDLEWLESSDGAVRR